MTVYGRTLNNKKCHGQIALVKDLMGKRTVFTRSCTERKDLDVVQVFVDMGTDFTAPAGLRVDVAITVESDISAPRPTSDAGRCANEHHRPIGAAMAQADGSHQ